MATDVELSITKRALIQVRDLKRRIEDLELRRGEPIAVVGMACRFPGAPEADRFWELLADGVDAIREVPRDRFDIDAYYDPDPEAPGKMSVRHGGFLEQVDQFDPQFFGISPREAVSLDPQQRLLLEVAWEALEHGGLAPGRLARTRTGVYVGLCSNDYADLIKSAGVKGIDAYLATGNSHSTAAGRLSFLLGLHGPSMAIDTACSSSLVAVHQARRALLDGDCDLALAGGVNVIIRPETLINFSKARMLSADGRCKTFDASADGFVRAEGCGLVVLKRLGDARRDDDRILAVIRGSAVNQDGATSALTAPNSRAQERVIAEALEQADIAPRDVAYLEAHGTGTSLGDPIEVHAASRVLGEGRTLTTPLLIGSVKTNIGHLEAAAGVAGLIKVILAMRYGVIPGQLHHRDPNPHVPWDVLPVRVVTGPTPWPEGRRIAGVSSFGFSGTNAHVVLEAAPSPDRLSEEPEPQGSTHLLAISGATEGGLRDLAGRYARWLEAHPKANLHDICFTAAVGRSHLSHRAAFVAGARGPLGDALTRLAAGESPPSTYVGHANGSPKLAMLFTGQGSQYAGMARGLYDEQPVFRRVLDRCTAILADELDRPLLEVIFNSEDTPSANGVHRANGHPAAPARSLDETRYAQPALVAVEVALYELYASLGVEPDAVLGHSVGEYAAAYAAGVLGLEDALRLVARRGRLMGELPAGGAMAAVFADEHAVAAAAESAGVEVAAYNGGHVVVSGPAGRVEGLVRDFERRWVRCVALRTSHAFHSALIEPALDGLERVAARVEVRPPCRVLVSNLTGRPMSARQLPDGAYWRRHAREPVRYADGVRALAELGCTAMLEIGPRPVLGGMAVACWPGQAPPASVAALRPGVDDDLQLREALAQLYASGLTPEFAALGPAARRRKVDLPTYPFQRQRYWIDRAPLASPSRGRTQHPLRGVAVRTAGRRGLRRSRGGPSPAAPQYGIRWQDAPPPSAPTTPSSAGSWLLLGDPDVIGPLAAQLAALGQQCVTATADGPPDLPPASAVHPLCGVIVAPRPVDDPPAAASAVCTAILELAGALLSRGIDVLPAGLWLLTERGVAAEPAEGVDPGQAAVWGLGRAITAERPGWACRLLDTAGAGPESTKHLVDRILSDPAEAEWAVRDDRWLVPRLVSCKRSETPPKDGADYRLGVARSGRLDGLRVETHDPGPPAPFAVRAEGTYLITGGMGALGLHTAAWLAGRGARQLVLVGRRSPDDEALRAIEAIRGCGCVVEVVQADISRDDEVGRVLDRIRDDLPPLRGIVHAAGVRDDAVLARQDSERLRRVMAAKVLGAWHLHQQTQGLPLDFFIVYSSVAAVLGSPGQANYAAANAFLDGLAQSRRALGLPALSVNWGPWAGGGMADDRTVQARLRAQGIETLKPGAALRALSRLVASGTPQGVVLRADWARVARAAPGERPRLLYAELARPGESSPPAASLCDLLRQTPVDERLAALIDRLGEEVRCVLSLATRPDPNAGFTELGMDSLMAVELRDRLQSILGATPKLSPTLAFDYPSVSAISQFILGQIIRDDATVLRESASTPQPRGDRPAIGSDPEDEADLDRVLLEKINLYKEPRR